MDSYKEIKDRIEVCKQLALFSEIEHILACIYADTISFGLPYGIGSRTFIVSSDSTYKKKEAVKKAVKYLHWDDMKVVDGYVRSILVSGISVTNMCECDGSIEFKHAYDDTTSSRYQVIGRWAANPLSQISYVDMLCRPFKMYNLVFDTYLINKIAGKNLEEDKDIIEVIDYFYNKVKVASHLPKSRFTLEPSQEDTEEEKKRYNIIIDTLQNVLKDICIQTIEYLKKYDNDIKDVEITKDDLRFL